MGIGGIPLPCQKNFEDLSSPNSWGGGGGRGGIQFSVPCVTLKLLLEGRGELCPPVPTPL